MNNCRASISTDVVIIGAGISGMATASRLVDRGTSVVVVEADDRVGGRTWSGNAPGGPIDFGGMHVGDSHRKLTELGQSLGLDLEDARPPGQMTYTIDGRVLRAKNGGYPAGPFVQDLLESLDRLDEIALEVGREAPWSSPRASELDRMTVSDWLDANITDLTVRAIHEVDMSTMLGAHPAEVSMLYWAYFVRQCDGIEPLQVGANSFLWSGGSGQITSRIADRIGDANVLLSSPATSINQIGDKVSVQAGPHSVVAEFAVVAMPPAAAARIDYFPRLPASRVQLQIRTRLGRTTKVQVRYPKRFWVENGFSGEIIDAEIGMTVLDGTRKGDSMGTLIGSIGGRNNDRWTSLPSGERRAEVLKLLTRAFGPEAAEPVFFHETQWKLQPWQGGGPSCFMPPGLLSTSGSALREPAGRLHFAGTESADQWAGYMEGAVRAGFRAADAISSQLGRS